jgi:hypothetical protein
MFKLRQEDLSAEGAAEEVNGGGKLCYGSRFGMFVGR